MTDKPKHRFCAALLPYDPITYICRRPIPMDGDATSDQQLAFYHALLEIPWFPPGARHAVAAKLGLGRLLQKVKRKKQDAVTVTWYRMFLEIKARMRENGKRPRGGIDTGALNELAEELGVDVDTIIKAFYRFKHPEQERLRKEREAEKRRERTDN
jgi:hypothetical protein